MAGPEKNNHKIGFGITAVRAFHSFLLFIGLFV
jgi:hypothetical protein